MQNNAEACLPGKVEVSGSRTIPDRAVRRLAKAGHVVGRRQMNSAR